MDPNQPETIEKGYKVTGKIFGISVDFFCETKDYAYLKLQEICSISQYLESACLAPPPGKLTYKLLDDKIIDQNNEEHVRIIEATYTWYEK